MTTPTINAAARISLDPLVMRGFRASDADLALLRYEDDRIRQLVTLVWPAVMPSRDMTGSERQRNCVACDHDTSCRHLAEQWGESAVACRRARRDECFREKGSVPLRTCARCGTEHYTPWCTGCGQEMEGQ